MRKRIRGLIAAAMVAVLAIAPATASAQADTFPDPWTQIVNGPFPIAGDGQPTYMANGWGRYYTGPNGLEIRFSSSGTAVAIETMFTVASLGVGTAISGTVTSVGGLLEASIPWPKVANALGNVGYAAGPALGDVETSIVQLGTHNQCLGATVPPGGISDAIARAQKVLGVVAGNPLSALQAALSFTGAHDNEIQAWFEPCSTAHAGLGDVVVPVSFPSVSGAVAAQSITPQPVGDRSVLHGPDGSLYVMAGGAKFAFPSWSEFVNLGYSTNGMVNVTAAQLAALPNVPRNGTVLRSGDGTLYTVAGGVKFPFGSMAEYHNQGYADGAWINTPQAGLNSIGSAPASPPIDGTVIQHPDGRLYIVVGGVKFYFGSMAEYGSLGYSTAQIARVPGAPTDGIPAASVATPPRNGTILRSGGGQMYVVAGGAKFYFGSMAEYSSLGYGTWLNVPQGPLDGMGDVPGNLPRDGTVLRSGGGQIYVVAGGAKLYFGSMTEYHNQGYSDGAWTSAPQNPLDAIGDTPGSMPRNGTVIQRPDGTLFVIAGGVRWAFGSMDQYYQLGYSGSQIVRGSQAPVDGIYDASASHLPANETLLQGSDATVWVMKNGQRMGFTSPTQFNSYGYSWSNITRVPDGILAGIPNGGNLP